MPPSPFARIALVLGALFLVGAECSSGGGSAGTSRLDFEASWETCLGQDRVCKLDGVWDTQVGRDERLVGVVPGGTNGVPEAPHGENVLELRVDGESNHALHESVLLDVSRSNHYFAYYERLNCDLDFEPDLLGHFFQNYDLGVANSTIFYFRHANSDGFPGPMADFALGFTSHAIPGSDGDFNGNGNYGGFDINQDDHPDPQLVCGRWHENQLWIECPQRDACLDTGFRENVAVRIHYRVRDVETGLIVLDDSNMRVHNYNAEGLEGEGFHLVGRVLEEIYAPLSQGGLDAAFAMHGGDPSFWLGPNGQRFTPEGEQVWGWVDHFRYRGSNGPQDWIAP